MRAALVTALVLTAVAVGCGSASSAPSATTGATTAATAEPATQLTLTLWPEGRQKAGMKRWTLRCAPAGGTHPRAGNACTRLAGMRAPFARPRADLACTQIYGGPQQALVSGTFRGNPVSVALGMADGCQIDRFKRLAFLFPGFAATANA